MNHHFQNTQTSNIPRSNAFDRGKFGRLFPWLSASAPDDEKEREKLKVLAENLVKGREGRINPAGYTYLGQFLAHDLSFDPTSISERLSDPEMLWNFRTPALDLDSVYGGGPQANPYLYTEKDGKIVFLLEIRTDKAGRSFWDLPRLGPVAVIPDPRNDENLIISQLHTAFMLFHNKIAAETALTTSKEAHFASVQQTVRWHFQYIIYNEFLRLFSTEEDIKQAFVERKYYTWRNEPFIPVEFSGAVLRFGHSIVRESYVLNITAAGKSLTGLLFGSSTDTITLKGGKIPDTFINWQLFFSFGNPTPLANKMHEINAEINAELARLPDKETSGIEANLAYRNLVRGLKLQLPSGEKIAQAMGIVPETFTQIDSMINGNPLLQSIKGNTPLWLYILLEAFNGANKGKKLGPVGSLIMAEVITGLLQGDKNSYFTQHPKWSPADELKTIAGILRYTGIEKGALAPPPSNQT